MHSTHIAHVPRYIKSILHNPYCTMPRSPDLPAATISIIMQKHANGVRKAQIARDLFLARSTVGAIIARGGVPAQKRPGRPRLIQPRTERVLLREVSSNPRVYATELAEELRPLVKVSPSTVRRALRRNRLASRVARRKPLLKKRHRRARLAFALAHLHKPLSFWARVLWSDESKFCRFSALRRRVWRVPGSALSSRNINGAVKHNGGNVMVWGCFAASGVGVLEHVDCRMDAERYISILERNLVAAKRALRLPRNFIFQHDNDPKHTAGKTKAWLAASGLRVLRWPACSPDLNPIEHLWELLDRRRKDAPELPLLERLQYAWSTISRDECKKLVESVPRRLRAVVEARGGHTRY